jgi:hypothetical protein
MTPFGYAARTAETVLREAGAAAAFHDMAELPALLQRQA